MKMDKKNIIIAISLITFALVLWAILYHLSAVYSGIGWILNIFSPFIIGGCLAFVINIPMSFFERILFPEEKIKGHPFLEGFKRPASLILGLLIIFAIIAVALIIIIPQLINSCLTISEKIPVYVNSLQEWAKDIQNQYPWISYYLTRFSINLNSIGNEVIKYIKSESANLLSTTVTAASFMIGGIVNFFIGFVFSIYCLLAKDTLTLQFRKILYAFNRESIADGVIRILRMASLSFSGFITGQCTEAIIVSVIFTIVLSICRFPYALMIGVTIGVLSLIPIVGAFIGCVIGALLVFLESPIKMVWFIIVFLVVQQIEDNLIYPKVVGDNVGLPSIWVLAAVFIGGNAFGMVGMICMIPLLSVVYTLLAEVVHKKLAEKNIPAEKLAAPEKLKKEKKRKKNRNKPEKEEKQ